MNRKTLIDPEELRNQFLVVDCHCDTILELYRQERYLKDALEKGHVDLPRLRQGNVRVQFFAIFIESSYKPFNALSRALTLIDKFYNELESCQNQVVLGLTMKHIKKVINDGKLVALLGIEGGEALAGNIAILRILHRLGVRLIGLTWNQRNELADGIWERATGGGLTTFGVEVIREMNRLGMMIDLSHISERGFWHTLEVSEDPVMVSHANCRKLFNHPRNLTDEQIKALAQKGGLLGLSFVPDFMGDGQIGIEEFLDHVDHVAGLVGTEVIALGSDFDGIESTPQGMEDCTCFPLITMKLLERGYTKIEVQGIMGQNALGFMNKVLKH